MRKPQAPDGVKWRGKWWVKRAPSRTSPGSVRLFVSGGVHGGIFCFLAWVVTTAKNGWELLLSCWANSPGKAPARTAFCPTTACTQADVFPFLKIQCAGFIFLLGLRITLALEAAKRCITIKQVRGSKSHFVMIVAAFAPVASKRIANIVAKRSLELTSAGQWPND